MRDMRKHERFKLDVLDLNSRMSIVGKVEIVDISVGGVALKADRKFSLGKECLIMLGYEGKQVNIKGTVVRSELSGIEEKADGGYATIYSAGVSFKEESAGKVREFLDSIEDGRKVRVPEKMDWLYSGVRFSITTPNEEVLHLPAQFGVKEISPSGVIIRTGSELNIDSIVLMELSIDACGPVSFMGKVVSCRASKDQVDPRFDVGVEFSELTDQSRSMLANFIDCVRDIKEKHLPDEG